MRLRGQVAKMWRRSKRHSAFYLHASLTTHIAGHGDTHPDELPPGPESPAPPLPCEPMMLTTIHRCFVSQRPDM